MRTKKQATKQQTELVKPVESNPTAAAPREWQIWEAVFALPSNDEWPPDGYLITEAGDINKVVGFAYPSGKRHKSGYKMALAFVANPDDDNLPVTDLRPFRHPKSPKPMPAFVYALQCRAVDEFGDAIDEEEVQEPNPLCHHRFKKMARQYAMEHFRDIDRERYPLVDIGLWDGDGSGVSQHLARLDEA